MKMHYEINGPVLTVRQERETDATTISNLMIEALQDPALRPGSVILWDASDSPAQASAEKLNTMLDGFLAISKDLMPCMAMVVSNELQFGVARMFQAYADASDLQVRCFYDEEEARKWLLDVIKENDD